MTMTETTPTPTRAMPACGNVDCQIEACQRIDGLPAPESTVETPTAPEMVPAPTEMQSGAGDGDAERGEQWFAYAMRTAVNGDWRDCPPATTSDLLAAIRQRIDRDYYAVRGVARTLRAYARNQSGETRQYLPTYAEMVRDGTLSHHAWHEHAELPDAWPIVPLDDVDRVPDASRVLCQVTAPERAYECHYGASVRDMGAAWRAIESIGRDDMTTLAESIGQAAVDNGWCSVFERLCDDLNSHMPAHIGHLFQRTEPPLTYWDVTGEVTVTFYLSGSTAAHNADEANNYASDALDNALYELRRQLERNVDASFNIGYTEVNDVEDTGEAAE